MEVIWEKGYLTASGFSEEEVLGFRMQVRRKNVTQRTIIFFIYSFKFCDTDITYPKYNKSQ